MQNLRGFKITVIEATDIYPEKIKIEDLRFSNKKIISYSFDSPNSCTELAIWYLKKLGIEIQFQTWQEKAGITINTILLTHNFKIKLK